MDLHQRKSAFLSLREKMSSISHQEKEDLFHRARMQNPWFTQSSCELAWNGLVEMLDPAQLDTWLSHYKLSAQRPLTVGIVMAGNIPMVGFHDLLCVLMSGHRAAIKMSSQDEVLLTHIINWLTTSEPRLAEYVEKRELLKNIDAVIATGSDNSARYFDYYFGGMPHVIRKNRTSIAILSGEESPEDLLGLANDIYSYFGLGCRNVSKVIVPEDYEITSLFPHWQHLSSLTDHHKYKNNYDYNKSIYLVNKEPHLDTGFSLWLESEALVSPISVTYIQKYKNMNEVSDYVANHTEKLQCIVGKGLPGGIPFGTTQVPKVWDYADNVDTLSFLAEL